MHERVRYVNEAIRYRTFDHTIANSGKIDLSAYP
jgi:hypothetical protein